MAKILSTIMSDRALIGNALHMAYQQASQYVGAVLLPNGVSRTMLLHLNSSRSNVMSIQIKASTLSRGNFLKHIPRYKVQIFTSLQISHDRRKIKNNTFHVREFFCYGHCNSTISPPTSTKDVNPLKTSLNSLPISTLMNDCESLAMFA